MEHDISVWTGVALAVIAALSTIGIQAVRAYYRVRAEIMKYQEIAYDKGMLIALKSTRLTEDDVTMLKKSGKIK